MSESLLSTVPDIWAVATIDELHLHCLQREFWMIVAVLYDYTAIIVGRQLLYRIHMPLLQLMSSDEDAHVNCYLIANNELEMLA